MPTAISDLGFGKGFLIDFNYDVEPLPGKFLLPVWDRSRCCKRAA